MKTDVLPGPWFTYVNVHEPVGDWRKVSFGGMDYSPTNAPERYYITSAINGVSALSALRLKPPFGANAYSEPSVDSANSTSIT